MKRQYCDPIRILQWWLRTVLFALVLVAPAQAAEVAARVQFVVGQVAAVAEAGERRHLRRGDEVYPGDTLHSAAASSAQLVFSDDSRMAVRANTIVRIEDYFYDANDRDASNAFIALLKGAVRSITGLIGQHDKRRVVMATPVATIGIRGTDYEVIHVTADHAAAIGQDLTGTYNKIYSGATLLRSARGALPLDAGQVGFVAGTAGNADEPVRIDALPDAVADMLARAAPGDGESQLAESSATRELIDSLLASNAAVLDLPPDVLGELVGRTGASVGAAVDTVGDTLGGVGGAVGGAVGTLGGAVGGVGGAVGGVGGALGGVGGAIGGVGGAIGGVGGAIGGVGDNLGGVVGGAANQLKLPGL